jgi:transposase
LNKQRKSSRVVEPVRVAKKVRHMTELFIGLDVHKDTIAVAIAEEGRSGDVRNLGTIEHTPGQITQLMKRLERKRTSLHFCYEAGPCGYGLHRQILDRGHNCIVVAPSTMPVKPGARIKTDRRDATNLARLLRAGELEGVWVPDPAHEAIRDLIRTRADAVDAVKRSKQQLIAFLLRHGRTFDGPGKWTRSHLTWLSEQKFEHPAHQIVCQDYINAIHDGQQRSRELEKMLVELIPTWSMEPVADALCSIRGISVVAASTILSATGDLRRFPTPAKLSAYFGLVPAEHSSGESINRMGITKRGNTEVRRVLTQCAWTYRFPARVTADFEKRNFDADKKVRELAWRAQVRLCGRHRRLSARGKRPQVVCMAIARELTCFIWEMGHLVTPRPA